MKSSTRALFADLERNTKRARDALATLQRQTGLAHKPLPPTKAYGAVAAGAFAIGALAIGAVAIGSLAIGAVAVKRAAVRRARIQRLEIDELVVGKLTVLEKKPASEEAATIQKS
jgi:hypothetical protein